MYKVVKLAYLLILIITITSCKTALINASEDGDLNRATVLLDQGADVNEGIFNGYNPLLAACWRFDAKIDMVKLLLERGANVNYRDLNRNTALNMAVSNNRIDIVRLLLKYGASKDLTGCVHSNDLSITPLELAQMKGNVQIIQLLETADSKGGTAYVKALPKSVQIGTIQTLNAGKREIVIATKRMLKVGELVYIEIDGNYVIMSATFPMMTLSKCQLEGKDIKYFDKLAKGMPVYKY